MFCERLSSPLKSGLKLRTVPTANLFELFYINILAYARKNL